MWYGRLATTCVWRVDQPRELLVERVALDQPEPPLVELRRESVPEESGEPTIQLDRRDRCPGLEQAGGQEAQARPDLEDAVAGLRARLVRGSPRGHPTSARKFWDIEWRARRPASAASAGRRPDRSAAPPSPRGSGAVSRRASGSEGRASRSRPARSPAARRRAAAAPIIAPLSVHRPGRGTFSEQAARLGLARDPGPERGVRRDAAAEDDRSGARPPPPPGWSSSRARRRPTSWKPQASSAVDRIGQVAVGVRPSPSARASSTTRRAAVLRPEKLKSYVSPSHARGNADVVPRRVLGRPLDRRAAGVRQARAAGRPCRTPRRRRRRPSGRGAGRSGGRVISTRNVWPPDTIRATSGKTGSGRSASPGSSSHAA